MIPAHPRESRGLFLPARLAALLLSPAACAQENPAATTGLFGAGRQQTHSGAGGVASSGGGQRADLLRSGDSRLRSPTASPAARQGGAAAPTVPAPAAPAPPSDIQGFVVASVGRPLPSDATVVATDHDPASWSGEPMDWSPVFFDFGLGVSALKVPVT